MKVFCEKCGAQMEEDTLFCPDCGNRIGSGEDGGNNPGGEREVVYCPACGEKNEAGAEFCFVCGAPLAEGGMGAKAAGAGVSRKKGKGLFAGIAAVAVIAAGIVFGVTRFGKSSGQETPLIYLKDNEIVCFDGKQINVFGEDVYKEKDDIYGPGSEVSSLVRFSEDGKYIFYPQDYEGIWQEGSSPDKGGYYKMVYDLYYRQVKDKKTAGGKLASSVEDYTVLKSGKVIYREEDKLYISDLVNKEKIASDVESYSMSEDEGSIFWKTAGDEGKLYLSTLDALNDKKKLDSDVMEVFYTSGNFATILYKKEEGLYCLKNYEDREKVTSDEITNYAMAESENGTVIYYVVEEDERFILADMVEDDLPENTEEDTAMRRYLREKILNEDGYGRQISTLYCYNPEDGENTKYAEGVLGDGNVYDGFFIGGEKNPSAFTYLYYDTDEIEKIKLSEIEKWTEDYEYESDFMVKVGEEMMKELLKTAELRLIRNGVEETVQGYDGEEYGNCSMLGTVESTKECYMIAMSLEDYIEDIYREERLAAEEEAAAAFDSEYGDAEYEAVGEAYDDEYGYGEEGAVSDEEGISADTDSAVDHNYQGTQFMILRIKYGEEEAGLELVAEEALSVALTDAGIYYTAEIETDENGARSGELLFNGERVDSDVMLTSIHSYPVYSGIGFDDKNGLLYLTDFSDKKREGTLKLYRDGEIYKIADDIPTRAYLVNSEGEVAYLSDYNEKKYRGDLKMYKGGESVTIDNDVTGILSF